MADAPKPNLEFLHKQIGPLPVGGWLVVVGAGLAFAWWRKRSTPTSSPSSESELSNMTDPGIGNLGLLSLLNKGVTGQPTAGTTDNVSWYRDALNKLLAKGYSTSLADTALRKYVQGMSLSREEQAVIDLAISLAGPIPSPPPPPAPSAEPVQTIQKSLGTYQVIGNAPDVIKHLSDYDLINASNLTSPFSVVDPAWADIVGLQYGTNDPLVYLDEVARRYQAGLLPESALKGPVGSWTNGQPAWNMQWTDFSRALEELEKRQPGRIDWKAS